METTTNKTKSAGQIAWEERNRIAIASRFELSIKGIYTLDNMLQARRRIAQSIMSPRDEKEEKMLLEMLAKIESDIKASLNLS